MCSKSQQLGEVKAPEKKNLVVVLLSQSGAAQSDTQTHFSSRKVSKCTFVGMSQQIENQAGVTRAKTQTRANTSWYY